MRFVLNYPENEGKVKILVLGGTGAIGVDLVNILVKNGHEVFVTSRQKKEDKQSNVQFIQGNAHNLTFLSSELSKGYDVVVDFMYYSSAEEFARRIDVILESTNRYVFLSSSRVYADSVLPLTEEASRLLDVCSDENYLKTDEYALVKARQENILFAHQKRNWTIIRPYITYNNNRLQLGIFEKEEWLYRALARKKIVFPQEMANRKTTLTYGYDVAKMIDKIIVNPDTLGEVYHITQPECITWGEVLELYLNILEKKRGFRPVVVDKVNISKMGSLLGRMAQIKYDRLYDRVFDGTKLEEMVEEPERYTSTKEGLQSCFEHFLDYEEQYLKMSPKSEAILDRFASERTPLNRINGWKNRIRYFIYRNLPICLIKLCERIM